MTRRRSTRVDSPNCPPPPAPPKWPLCISGGLLAGLLFVGFVEEAGDFVGVKQLIRGVAAGFQAEAASEVPLFAQKGPPRKELNKNNPYIALIRKNLLFFLGGGVLISNW